MPLKINTWVVGENKLILQKVTFAMRLKIQHWVVGLPQVKFMGVSGNRYGCDPWSGQPDIGRWRRALFHTPLRWRPWEESALPSASKEEVAAQGPFQFFSPGNYSCNPPCFSYSKRHTVSDEALSGRQGHTFVDVLVVWHQAGTTYGKYNTGVFDKPLYFLRGLSPKKYKSTNFALLWITGGVAAG